MTAKQKTALQARHDALEAASLIADDTARQEALQSAHETMRDQKPTDEEIPAELQTIMDSVKSACGGTMMFKGPGMGERHGRGGPGFMKFDLAEKLGMTAEELKAELSSGKTIEDIATEKDVELPARPVRGMPPADDTASSSVAQ